ncbi:hypothetical protein M9Y10_021784 [Tritrichomonas musculus]|uniref:BZIP domain-containing protein n=1 Tax=Tritrichomonas musculus TaxID=1915356 RepID=A0ABR2KR11_9EUKA
MASNQDTENTLPQIFCLNTIQMMCSMYFYQDDFQIQPYPIVPESSNKETKFAFQSRVVDLKLRRISEKSHEIQNHFNQSLLEDEEKNNQLNQKENETDNNIDEAFIDAPAPRPKNYKYLTLVDKEKYIPKKPSKCLDFRKIAKEQRVRLDNAREKGINRARRRAERMKMNENYLNNHQTNIANKENYYVRSENSESNV